MSTPIAIVDAFVTDAPFTGNPAAVCMLPEGGCGRAGIEPRLQAIAAEMNLSETAFVSPVTAADAADTWDLRWFTPGEEVELCGHATIAAAHALRADGLASADASITFRTSHRGELVVRSDAGRESVGLPVAPLEEIEDPDPALFEGLAIDPRRVVRTLENDLVVVLDDGDSIRRLRPDMRILGRVSARGIAATAPLEGDAEGAVVSSRYFAPGVAVDEDPVTGSLHSSLGLLWRDRFGDRFLARQESARGGVVAVDATRGAEGIVVVAGAARMVMRGRWLD